MARSGCTLTRTVESHWWYSLSLPAGRGGREAVIQSSCVHSGLPQLLSARRPPKSGEHGGSYAPSPEGGSSQLPPQVFFPKQGSDITSAWSANHGLPHCILERGRPLSSVPRLGTARPLPLRPVLHPVLPSYRIFCSSLEELPRAL